MRLLILLSLASLPQFAQASNHAICQTKLMRVASDALEKNFFSISDKVWVIREATFNYGLEGKPRVIYIAGPAKYSDNTCIIDVRTEAEAEVESGCPDYRFTEIRTTCE